MGRGPLSRLQQGEPHILCLERYVLARLIGHVMFPERINIHERLRIILDGLNKSKLTGDENIDGIQDSLNDTVGNTLAPGQIGGIAGDAVDKNLLRGNFR